MSVCMCACVHLTDVSVIKQNFRQSIKFAAAHTSQSFEPEEEAQTERGRQRVVPKGKSVRGEERRRGRIYIFTTYKQGALAFYAFAFCCIKTERVLMQQPNYFTPLHLFHKTEETRTEEDKLINTYEVFT